MSSLKTFIMFVHHVEDNKHYHQITTNYDILCSVSAKGGLVSRLKGNLKAAVGAHGRFGPNGGFLTQMLPAAGTITEHLLQLLHDTSGSQLPLSFH